MPTTFALLLWLNGLAGIPSDQPTTGEERLYDQELGKIVQLIMNDPGFARFHLVQPNLMHFFMCTRKPGETGWRSVSILSEKVTDVPDPSSQTASRPEVHGKDGIRLDIFIEKTPMGGLPPDWDRRVILAPGVCAKWYILINGNADDLNARVASLIRRANGKN